VPSFTGSISFWARGIILWAPLLILLSEPVFREALASRILLANSKSGNFNGFQIGIAKTRLQRFTTAAAINLERVSDWLAGIGREKTGRSAFARMMRPLTA